MPTENELKFVLNPAHFHSDMRHRDLGYPRSLIHQGYLYQKKKSNLRVRMSTGDSTPSNPDKFLMTYKRQISDRVVEINTPICERDFMDLWDLCEETLMKVRVFVDGWDVDFFLDSLDRVYFVLAECEMPEGQDRPDTVPDLVANSLIYEVPRDDDRFSSRKLSNVPYSRALLRKVFNKGKKNERSRTAV